MHCDLSSIAILLKNMNCNPSYFPKKATNLTYSSFLHKMFISSGLRRTIPVQPLGLDTFPLATAPSFLLTSRFFVSFLSFPKTSNLNNNTWQSVFRNHRYFVYLEAMINPSKKYIGEYYRAISILRRFTIF